MATELGKLVILSGPSGAGKSTVIRRLIEICPLPIELSVSATTRSPREGEIDGIHYHFLSLEEFETRRKNGEFLETMEVFGQGDWYGTLKSTVASGLNAGKWVLLEIDVQGALKVIEQIDDVLLVFVHPGSMEELEHRLRHRRTETDQAIEIRLARARRELELSKHYQHIIVNREPHQAAEDISKILSTTEKDSKCMKS